MRKHVSPRVAGAVALAFLSGAAQPLVAQEQEDVALDRWLVSSPFPANADADPLEADYLAAPGEVAVLPDRGRTVAGADWTLVRRDSSAVLDLESHRGDADGQVVVYAHAYLKSTGDRTIAIEWGGLECTRVDAWLNGRSLTALGRPAPDSDDAGAPATARATVRIGHGYNTFLLKAASGDCRFGVTASVTVARGESGDGFRVQASRPYGDTRTGPEPWLIAEPEAGPEPVLGWKEDELFGAAGVRLAAFAVTAIEGARLEAKAGGEEVKREIEWFTPAEPETVLMPFSFKSLQRAVTGGTGMDVELEWKEGEWKGVLDLDPSELLAAFHSSIRLLGWTVEGGIGAGAESPDAAAIYDAEREPHPLANLAPLPESSGTTLFGQWKVPGWLSGFTLRLDVEGAPGEYRLNSVPVDPEGLVLCESCRKGDRLQIVVVTGGAWERFPGVSIADVAPPEAHDASLAAEWLRMIDEKGSRQYRDRSSAGGP